MTDQTQDQTAPAVDGQQTSLQLSDILLTAQVIQLASQRGAFRAEELTQVGGLYDRLISFLKSTGALQQPASDAPAQEGTAEQPAA